MFTFFGKLSLMNKYSLQIKFVLATIIVMETANVIQRLDYALATRTIMERGVKVCPFFL